jgi:hypothetical protein
MQYICSACRSTFGDPHLLTRQQNRFCLEGSKQLADSREFPRKRLKLSKASFLSAKPRRAQGPNPVAAHPQPRHGTVFHSRKRKVFICLFQCEVIHIVHGNRPSPSTTVSGRNPSWKAPPLRHLQLHVSAKMKIWTTGGRCPSQKVSPLLRQRLRTPVSAKILTTDHSL